MSISPVLSVKTTVTNPIYNKQIVQPQRLFGGSFSDIFTSSKSKDINEIKDLKTKSGNPRFNNKEIKEIKSLKNKDKIDNNVIKQFSNTMLDVKSMSEVYLHAKEISKGDEAKASKEYGIIKNLVKSYEEPFNKWSDSLKEDYHTTFERIAINKEPAYKLKDCFEHKTGIYKADGKLVSEDTVTAGSSCSADSYGDDDTKPITYTEPSADGTHPFDLGNLLNPFNPFS